MRARITRGSLWISIVVAVACCGSRAEAFKWHECPAPPVPVYPSTLGATGSPFAHPGHEVSIFLNDVEVQASGGFSTSEGGNSVAITFASLFGDPIALSPRTVTAASPAALTFDFPDTPVEVGRTLAGPVEIVVTVGDVEVAHISAQDFVGLPAAIDITPTVVDGVPDQVIEAALDSNGDLWVPAAFSGHGMSMPGCVGNFVMPVPLNIGGAVVVGTVLKPVDPMANVRQIDGYLGDMVINGTSFYGMLYPERIQLIQVAGSLGVSLCRLNDAMDIVLRVHGNQCWASEHSPFRLVASDSTPLALQLDEAPLLPQSDVADARSNAMNAPGRVDSFGNQCSQLPTNGKPLAPSSLNP